VDGRVLCAREGSQPQRLVDPDMKYHYLQAIWSVIVTTEV